MSRQTRLALSDKQYTMLSAIHEAGHAVASDEVGLSVKYIELNWRNGLPDGGRAVTGASRDVSTVVSFHAGLAAEEIWYKNSGLWTRRRMEISRNEGARRDMEVIQKVTPSRRDQEQHYQISGAILTRRWRAVERVAQELTEKRGRMPGRRFRQLAR